MSTRIAWLDGKTLDPDQNAFGVLAQVERWLRQLGTDRDKIEALKKECFESESNAAFLQKITDATGIEFS